MRLLLIHTLHLAALLPAVSPLSPPKLLATKPVTLLFDDFATPDECASLLTDPDRYVSINANESTDPHHATLQLLAERLGRITGVPPHSHETFRRHINGPTPPGATDSLHVDTNNGKLATFATGICYLTAVPEGAGGATNLPLADADDDDGMLVAARELVEANVHHVAAVEHDACGMLSESTEGGGGVRVQPKLGQLLLFYGRDDSGKVDPRSWHRADPIYGDDAVKGIAVFLKEVPLEQFSSMESFHCAVSKYVQHGHDMAREAGSLNMEPYS